MIKTRFLALVTALALLLAIPAAVLAQKQPPHQFVGAVTLDGATAVDGAAVTAWVEGEQVADTNVASGRYSLQVDQGDASFVGETISFKVSGANATETATWEVGGGTILDLTGVTGSGGGTGTTGETGSTGAQGPQGVPGADGSDGAAGATGAAGSDGSDGADGAAGSDGSDGAAGAAGSAGPPGPAGADGSGGGLGVIALIVAIVALLAAGGSYMMGRRA